MRRRTMSEADELQKLPPERRVSRLLPEKPTTAEGVAVPSRIDFAGAVARRIHRDRAGTLRQQRKAAPGIAAELIALPPEEATGAIRRSRGRMYSPPLVEELTRRSGEAAPVDADLALRIADLAEEVLTGIPEKVAERFQRRYWLDLRASLAAERANALRIQRRWRAARLTFREAFHLMAHGSGDGLLFARVAYLAASHYWRRNRLRAAGKALALAATTYAELGEEGLLGETQLKQAALLDYRGLLPEAIKLQAEALGNLDETAAPVTAVAAYTNLAELLRRTGDPLSGLAALADCRHLVEELGNSRAHGVWYWIRGRCHMASGTLDGEPDLRNAWRILETADDTYSLGLVGVDLCRYYLDECNLQQLEHWVGPTVRNLELHAPTPDLARELSKLGVSVQTLKLNAAQVSQVLELVSRTMDQRRGSQEGRRS